MRIIIVDENDNQIDLKDYEQIEGGDIYRVSGLWLSNSAGQILLAQRKLAKHNDPGKWACAVAGTVEEGETYESNIYKEAAEEIGLTGPAFKKGAKLFNDYGKHKFFVQWFSATVDWPLDKFQIQQDEVEQIAWIDRDQLVKDLKADPSKYIAGASFVWKDFLV